jgi:hypothetical protein
MQVPARQRTKLVRVLAFAAVTRSITGKSIPIGGIINAQGFQNLAFSKSQETDLSKNAPVVLLRGMLPVLLEAETSPTGQKVLWDVQPDPANPSSKPRLDPISGVNDNKALLHCDKPGAFSVLVRVDPADRPMVWNVVFVDVTIQSSIARGNPAAGYISTWVPVGSNVTALQILTGDHATKFGWSADVNVVLGGAGARSSDFDKIELHMLHNGTADNVTGHYFRKKPLTVFNTREEVAKLPAVDTEDPKLTITPDKHFPGSTAFSSTPSSGTNRTLKFFDTPRTELFRMVHKNHSDADLAGMDGQMDFSAAVAAVSTEAPHTIVVYGVIKWSANFMGSVTLGPDPNPSFQGTVVPTWTPNPSIAGTKTAAQFAVIPGGSDAADQGFEVWPPNLMNQLRTVADP